MTAPNIECSISPAYQARFWAGAAILGLLGGCILLDAEVGATAVENAWLYGSAGGCFLAAASVAIWILSRRRVKLRFENSRVILPSGSEIEPGEITEVDLTEWSDRGLVRLRYIKAHQIQRASIDEFQFAGAAKVIEQLLARIPAEANWRAPSAARESAVLEANPHKAHEVIL